MAGRPRAHRGAERQGPGTALSFSFRPLAADDLSRLLEWVRRPHVARWWGPCTPEELERDYGAIVRGEDSTRAFIACWQGRPVGFVQVYEPMQAGGGWWEDETDPGRRGIDQFLAEPELLGRGLGSAMVCSFVERLFEDDRVTGVQVDPAPDNARAIRCYARAGFVAQGEVATPDGPALLMVVERFS
jgi:RimJ/RimL family protein N-acetyltransferase